MAETYEDHAAEASWFISSMALDGIDRLSREPHYKSSLAPLNPRRELGLGPSHRNFIHAQTSMFIAPREYGLPPQLQGLPHTFLHETELQKDILRIRFLGRDVLRLPDWPSDRRIHVTVKDSVPEADSHFSTYNISTQGYASRHSFIDPTDRPRQVAIAGLVAHAVHQAHGIDLGVKDANNLYNRLAHEYEGVPLPAQDQPCWSVLTR